MSEKEILELLLSEIKGIKQDITSLDNKINSLDNKFDNLQNQVDTISNEVVGIKLTLENVTNRNINLLVDGHSNTDKKLENHETRITKLEKLAI